MRVVSHLRATPHLAGRRIDLHWKNPATTAYGQTAELSRVVVVRKERTFPESPSDGLAIYTGVVANGTLRSHFSDVGLEPLTTYYYTLFAIDTQEKVYSDDGCKVSAFATNDYNLALRLYRLLPAVHQRLDRPLRADELAALPVTVQAALQALPPALQGTGQLRRFLHALLAPLDLMRSFAEGLPRIQNAAIAPPEFLLPLASSLGWELDRTLPVYRQRNEIRDAPRNYRTVGTIPNLRSIVNRYARWYAQVAEMDERIVRATAAPKLNVYSIARDGDTWRGTDDAAPFLGFGKGNDRATGAADTPETPATLTGTLSAPFSLRPGMELAISTDGRPPACVRFQTGDFKDITQAQAVEVAAVLGKLLPEIRCDVGPGETLVLTTHTLGTSASLEVLTLACSLLTLESAPRGRIATCTGALGRQFVFYQVNDPLEDAEKWEAAHRLSDHTIGDAAVASAATAPLTARGQIRYKILRGGEWSASIALPTDGVPAADPAVARLNDGTIFAAWVENPDTGLSRIRYRFGFERPPVPAELVGRRRSPFPVRPGMRLLINRGQKNPLGFEFAALDFADSENPTEAEVVGALGARLPGIQAGIAMDGTLHLTTTQLGGEARIDIDLAASTAAEALGFEEENHFAVGDWGDGIDWQPAQDVDFAPQGTATDPRVYADLHAMTDDAGNLRLVYACHAGDGWAVFSARGSGGIWTYFNTLSTEGGGNREPFLISTGPGSVHVFWSRREGVGTLEDHWTLRCRKINFGGGFESLDPEPPTSLLPEVAADRQPAAIRVNNDYWLFFQSNRVGNADIWWTTFDPAAGTAADPPTKLLVGAQADHMPTPLIFPSPDNRVGMLFRSARGFDLSRAATRYIPVSEGRVTFPAEAPVPLPPAQPSSFRTEDSGTQRRFAGSTSIVLADEVRRERMRQWDDLVSYTPQGVLGEPLSDDDLYTRGTVGLFLSPLISIDPLTPAMIERLRAVMGRFLPVNVRTVVVLAPRVDIEYIDIPRDSYYDDHPDIDYYVGPTDMTAVDLPDWSFLISNTPGHVSWDPANPSSLFHRVFYEPPQ